MRCGPDGDGAGGLPEDVLRQSAACQCDAGCAGLIEVTGYLEDPDVVGAAREGDVGGDEDAGPHL